MHEIIPRTETQQDFSDPKVRSEARAMYYSGVVPTEIAAALQIPFPELKVAVFGKDGKGRDARCWFAMKKRRDQELGTPNRSTVTTYQKTKYYFLKQTEANLLDLVRKSLAQFNKDGTLLYTMPEIKQALEALSKLDSISRIEAGQPTQIVQIEHGLTLGEITQSILKGKNDVIEIDGDGNRNDQER